jgi:hypothetical protein
MSGGADEAIAALNGAQFQGRTLTVNEAKPREARPAGSGGGGRGGYGGGGGGGGYGGGGGGGGGRPPLLICEVLHVCRVCVRQSTRGPRLASLSISSGTAYRSGWRVEESQPNLFSLARRPDSGS